MKVEWALNGSAEWNAEWKAENEALNEALKSLETWVS